MASNLKSKDISDNPELLALANEIVRTQEGLILRSNDGDLAVIQPIPPKARKRHRKHSRAEDPIWGIIGMSKGGEPSNVAENKHAWLAEAYADLHDSDEG